MGYTKFQKFISSFLLFLMLSSITFRFPLLNFSALAGSADYYDLVSIIIDETTYSKINSEIRRYSRDISSVLNNTKIIVLPVPDNATPYEIASINEALYYDGHKSLSNVSYESKLIWTVLVWNIPLPIVNKDNQSSKTILPYTDFENKAYIFDVVTWEYNYNNKNTWINPDIWHWVISPNTWNFDSDIKALKDYFDKNTDFYNWNWFYDVSKNSISWKWTDSLLDTYEPYVFYFDLFREEKALNYNSYIWYQAYLENKEDIIYNRFTKELAQKLKDQILSWSNSQLSELAKKVDPSIDQSILDSSDNLLENVPDIQSRYIINNSVKDFVEIFSKWIIWEFRWNVFNAWRYNYWQNVNVDFVPYIVTVLDLVNDEIIKSFNDELEEKIDDIVKNWLSRNIAIPTTYYYEDYSRRDTYENFLFWKSASTITKADQCSIYRGSLENWWTLVEANRWLNVHNIEVDQKVIESLWISWTQRAACYSPIQNSNALNWVFWMNSPFNLDKTWNSWNLRLANSDLKWSIRELYDIAWSKSINDPSKTNNPFFCIDNNYLLSNRFQYLSNNFVDNFTWINTYKVWTYTSNSWLFWATQSWTCNTDVNSPDKVYNFSQTFDQNFLNLSALKCERNSIILDWNKVKERNYSESCFWEECECSSYTITNFDWSSYNTNSNWKTKIYSYKSIPSYIFHKSPTSEYLWTQIDSLVSPSLPVNKDRYVDFISANWNYSRIDYPHLYRLKLDDISDIDVSKISIKLDSLLDSKSLEINNIINSSKPWVWTIWNWIDSWNDISSFFESLSNIFNTTITESNSQLISSSNWKFIDNTEINWFLSTWNFPSSNVDLKSFLKSKWNTSITLAWETKVVSYYDMLVFALYWNNLNSVSSKYWYVFENYLIDQSTNDKTHFLPENRSLYEIAYLWAPWDASNMYIGLDPESKWNNPYWDILSSNQDISTKLLWLNIWTWTSHTEWLFKCAPPEWVPIWEWIPAVMCRLWEMMPPTIKISDWACWPSLLTNKEREELYECNWDINKNWINDCLETKISEWNLVLRSDTDKYFFNQYIPLNASIESNDWNLLRYLWATDIDFSLVKLEVSNDDTKSFSSSNKKIIFDINDPYKKDYSLIKDYINFNPLKVKTVWWISNYWFSVKNKELNATFVSGINLFDDKWNLIVSEKSNELIIQVRWDRLFSSVYNIKNTDDWLVRELWNSFLKANDTDNLYIFDWYKNSIDSIINLVNNNSISDEKLLLKLENFSNSWEKLPLNYPINYNIKKWNSIFKSWLINKDDLNNFFSFWWIKESWNYVVEFTDSFWSTIIREINVNPNSANKLDLNLSSNLMQSWWSVSTNFVTILDKFWNPLSGEFFDIKFNISWNWVVFLDNWKKDLTTSTFEWYNIFRLKSTENIWINDISVSLYDSTWNFLFSTTKELSIIDEILVDLNTLTGDLKVWNNSSKLQLLIRDKSWKLINNFNSRWYLNINSSFISLDKPYFEINNWIWLIDLSTKTIAWKEIPLEIQIEWINSFISDSITILPDLPVKMDLVLSKSKMEALSTSFSILTVELKDKYNNLTFNDSNTNTSLEILPEYSHILTTDTLTKKVSGWKAAYRIYWTKNPWVWYFKVSTNPSLSLNSFLIEDESGSITINWVWENASKIETFYVWNKDKLKKWSYNSIYTTLLWSNYWDIDQIDYLAWALIFDKNSKALAVTSLLNNPFSVNDTFSILNNGWINKMYSPSDLSQDISTNVLFESNKLFINLFNNSLNTYIWKISYNLPDKTNFVLCESWIFNCSSQDKTSIISNSLDDRYVFYTSNWKLYLRDYLWKTHFTIEENWNFIRNSNLTFDLWNYQSNWLLIDIKSWDKIIWNLLYKFSNSDLYVSREELSFNNRVNSSKNAINIFINSNSYWSYFNWRWNNSYLNIYYNDPFWSKSSLTTFSRWNNYSYENFENKSWLWWSEWNKSLLSFSAWTSVWESVKNFASFSTINIWDPVVSLKQIRKTFNNTNILKQFDSTIWKIISSDTRVENYRIFDYNNDWLQDIILILRDWYIKLLENKNVESRFLDMWYLANIIDLWNHELLHTWDFTWDWFPDIFFVWVDWKPYLLNNINKDFSRLSLSNKFNLSWKIIRAEVFDMDNDWIDDIVTLDDAWEINIFYWWWISSNPVFTKLTVSDDYWLKLSSEIRNDSSLLYFDWLYQIENNLHNLSIIDKNQSYLNNLWTQNTWERVNYDLLNSIIYKEVPYIFNDVNINNYDYNNYWSWNDFIELVTFIKWEYSSVVWLEVSKTLIDRNWWSLVSSDIVDVEIIIENKSWKRLNNIAYIEDVYNYFNLDFDSISNSKNLEIKRPKNSYDFLIDNFSLNNWEKLIINYEVSVKPLKYSYIELWYFEDWEDWDDLYWDILLKDTLENCSEPVEIFRSISSRLYKKWIKNPSCDNSVLPEEILRNSLDSNWNGIPDYIEELTWSLVKMEEYSNNSLSWLFTDSNWSGIPDDEERFNWRIVLDGWDLWKQIDSWLDNLQNLINWFSCWFNNWACFASPLNWAPLAPWWDPTFMWYPIWDWLNIWEWLPVFSALTWLQTMCWTSPCCLPTIWPVSSLAYVPWPTCWTPSAWWQLWTWAPTNTFRLFVTPTLTWWVWLAACFWWPAMVAWYSNMPWISPLFPGWNCIVVAKPLLWCSNDWSDWDPSSIGNPTYWSDFWFINWNCSSNLTPNYSLDPNYVKNYYNHLNWWSIVWLSDFKWAISDHNSNINWPLFQLWEWWNNVSVTIDSSNWTIDYSDIQKIIQKRIQSFPWFLMNWVTRQIEEIVNKLTDFPTVFVILPDFSWIYDIDISWEENRQNWLKNSWNNNRLWNIDYLSTDSTLSSNETINNSVNNVKSWIKDAYEFIASLPLVKIEQQTVYMEIPWISETEINKSILSRQATIDSRKNEYNRALNSWSLWSTCSFSDALEQQRCIENNEAAEKISFEITWLIWSLEANLDVLNDYKKTPEKINKLLNKKEVYLEQILCNIENISSILWWRIWKNWERFKAWVELYILIKAILKSWQLLIDVFIDYEEECRECKNERQDLLNFQFELISMVVPDIPVIEFPKWPDIIIDLHNIRAWMNIALPEFSITAKPILLPELPNLYLPDFPNIDIILNLPDLPILPRIEIPELPDLPTLPTVELPDLPPPPTLPKMFAQLEAILDILKLITKAMCILKSSPFVPEWRAWDQIAFLTERNWYLPTDFLSVSLPQFSFPWIDAIKVTTYVNLEFETDFIVELARQVAMPINSFTSDFTNLFNIWVNDLDFRNIVPNQININIWETGVDSNLWINNSKISEITAFILTKNILNWRNYISNNKNKTVSNLDFKKEISKNLASEKFSSDPRFDELRNLWDNVNKYTFSWEDNLIKDLQDNNFNKFQTLSDIINTEIIKNNEFKNDFNELLSKNIRKTSIWSNSNVWEYNTMLSKYNESFFRTTWNILNEDDYDSYSKDLKNSWNDLLNKVNTSLWKYTLSWNSNTTQWLLANILNGGESINSCSWSSNNWESWYNYEGIYILENNRSYRLFDYTNELLWDEKVKIIDFDNDLDEDLLYFSNNTLYLKENLKVKENRTYPKEDPIIISSKNNKFVNWSEFYSAVNNASEITVSSWIININFLSTPGLYNYRLSFYSVVDRFLNILDPNYKPDFRKKSIIDSIAWIWDVNFIEETDLYIERKDLVFIENLWDLKWVQLYTDELKNIRDDLTNWNVVVISNGTTIYSWESTMVLKYVEWDWKNIKSIVIPRNRNLELKNSLRVVWITGNWYIRTWNKITVEWTDIRKLKWMPLFVWSKFNFIWNDFEVRDNNYVNLRYYDNSRFQISFKEVSDWTLYNLWRLSKDYLISVSRNNDYYYSKLNWFKNDILSTSTNQILLSPQIRADNISPEINLWSIKVPVYQKMEINITPYLYENSWISWIHDIYIDFNLDIDSDWDWNPKNDNDSLNMDNLNIRKTTEEIFLDVWPFDELFNKKIWITLIDHNSNVWYKEIKFEVYSPNPEIDNLDEAKIYWYIDENLDSQPVSLFRYRWGEVIKLSNDLWNNIAYTQDWDYEFVLWDLNDSWLKITKNWNIIASVNEKTWKIITYWPLNSIDVIRSNSSDNDTVFPKIIVKDWVTDIFYQTINVNWNKSVNVVDNFDSIKDSWVYVQFINKINYSFYILPENIPNNPWTLSIYRNNDVNKESLFTIFNDWRINTLNNNYYLKYDYYDDYVVFMLVDKNFNRDIASVLFKVDSDYIIK